MEGGGSFLKTFLKHNTQSNPLILEIKIGSVGLDIQKNFIDQLWIVKCM